MCNSSSSPGKTGGNWLGVLAVMAAVIFVAAIAHPVIHAAETVLRITVEVAALTLLAVPGAVILIITARMVIRRHRVASGRAHTRSQPRQVSRWLGIGALPQRHESGSVLQLVHPQREVTATRPEPGASYQTHPRPGRGPTVTTHPDQDSRWP
jgi:hypothetical protein